MTLKENSAMGIALVMIIGSLATISAMMPNPIISRGKPVYTSSGTAPYLVDNIFKGTKFSVTNNSWVAINVGLGPSKVIFNWNDPDSAWADTIGPCHHTYSIIANYDILKSSNSTNGTDGTWTLADSIRGNMVTSRCHTFDFTGASWIKMNIKTGGPTTLDEIEVFDASKGTQDSWCFVGTSITQMTFKDLPPATALTYPGLVTAAHPKFTPAIVRAGIGCTNSGDVANHLHSTYLASARNVNFWAIEMGANDALQNVPVATFIKNMTTIIDSCIASGIHPVLARTPAFNASKAGTQIPAGYLTAIDSLTKRYSLIPGPDFYTYFTNHITEINSGGVHPTSTGIASIQRLWAQTMSPYYDTIPTRTNYAHSFSNNQQAHTFAVNVHNGIIGLKAAVAGTASIYSVNGKLTGRIEIPAAGSFFRSYKKGMYLVKFVSSKEIETAPVMIF